MPRSFDVLYKRDEKGRVRVWYMEQEDDKFRTVAGIQDGALVTSDWTVAEPKNTGKKNATTGPEQALKEIQAKYTKQLKSDYFININDIDTVRFIQPMLAHKYSEHYKKVDFASGEWIFQCKFNGIRCNINKDNATSRTGEVFQSIPHITEDLKGFFEQHPDAVLDGELYNHDLRQYLNEISSLCSKKDTPKSPISTADYARSRELIQLHIYDGYGFNDNGTIIGKELPYSIRKAWIDNNVIGRYEYVRGTKDYTVYTEDEMLDIYKRFLEDKQEGGILRKITAGYEHKRSYNLLKTKPTDDAEFEIVDILPGGGNWAGKAKRIVVKFDESNTFEAVFKGTMEEGAECLNNKDKWIGRTVTIHYFGFTGLGTPQFSQFDYRNCLKGDRK